MSGAPCWPLLWADQVLSSRASRVFLSKRTSFELNPCIAFFLVTMITLSVSPLSKHRDITNIPHKVLGWRETADIHQAHRYVQMTIQSLLCTGRPLSEMGP